MPSTFRVGAAHSIRELPLPTAMVTVAIAWAVLLLQSKVYETLFFSGPVSKRPSSARLPDQSPLDTQPEALIALQVNVEAAFVLTAEGVAANSILTAAFVVTRT